MFQKTYTFQQKNIFYKETLPKKLLACSGNHLSLLPQIANTITAMQPHTPPPSRIHPVLCKKSKWFPKKQL